MKRFICILTTALGLGINLISVASLFMIISALFETPVPYSFSVLEILLMALVLLMIFIKNIIVICYAAKNDRSSESKEKVIKNLVFGDYLSLIIPIAISVSFFIEEFSVNSFKAYLYPFFILMYLVCISWGSHFAWYCISKMGFAHFEQRCALLNMYSKYRTTFTVLAYIMNVVFVFASNISIFINLLMRSNRPYMLHILAFACLNLLFLLIFVFVKVLRGKHILVMVCVDAVILSLVFLMIAVIFTDNKISLMYGLNAVIYVFSTLICYLMVKKSRGREKIKTKDKRQGTVRQKTGDGSVS